MKWVYNDIRKSILKDDHRFKVLSCGRRWGKTHLALLWLLKGEISPNERRWVVMPTYRQAKVVAFPILKGLFREFGGKINESELSIHIGEAEIALKGADNEDSLRGVGLQRVVLDEYAYMKPHVWEEIILPMLATTKGKAMFIGTPNSHNHFYDLYLKGLGDSKDWKSWAFKTIEGGFVDADEIDNARSNMDARLFRQEFEATFETAGNRCAYNFDRDLHVQDRELSTNLMVSADFNVDYMTGLVSCQYTDNSIHFFDEVRLSNSNTMELATELKRIAPNVPCYPDPAGKARSTNSSKSDHQILRDNGFIVFAKKAHPSHRDRLNALNMMLLDGQDNVRMTVSPKCKYLIKDLEQVQRDKNGGIDKSDVKLTHALDACSYLIDYKFPVLKREMQTLERIW